MAWLRSSLRPRARLLTGLAAIGIAAAVVRLTPEPIDQVPVDLAAATLVTTAATGALFDADAMVPGRAETRCLDVTLPTPPRSALVLVRATHVSGDLADRLSVVIETGPATGSPTGSCAGFSGEEVYRGTLAGLAATSARDPYGVDTGWTLTSTTRTRAFRITTEVADVQSAQGDRAAADLLWASVAAPTVSPTPGASAEPTATPSAPGGAPGELPTSDPTDSPTPDPSEEPSVAPTDEPDDPATAVPGPGGSGPDSPIEPADGSVLRTILEVTEKLARP